MADVASKVETGGREGLDGMFDHTSESVPLYIRRVVRGPLRVVHCIVHSVVHTSSRLTGAASQSTPAPPQGITSPVMRQYYDKRNNITQGLQSVASGHTCPLCAAIIKAADGGDEV